MEGGAGLDAQQRRAVDDAVAACRGLDGALLPMLHHVQDALGYVPPAAVPVLADATNQSVADVHGVVSFYHDFRTEPPGRHVLRLCRAEACQARGANALVDYACQRAGVALGETRADGALTVEAVYCLGLCASGPAALVDGRPVARLSAPRVEAFVAAWTSEGGR